jgi:uncharacterized protein YdaU (DUF1376 family)
MKRGAPPYVPWFHGDFLRSTAGWMPMERFTYWMLLCAQHETGVLPTDMARLATIAGIDMATMSTVWPVVGKKFGTSRAGLVNRRMDEHRRKQIDFRRRQSDGGKLGMARRYGRTGTDSKVIEFPPGKEKPRG